MDHRELELFFRFVITVAAENNIRLLGVLFEDDYSISELAMLLDLDPTAVEFGLSQLIELNLVSTYERGMAQYYHLQTELLHEIATAMSGVPSDTSSYEDFQPRPTSPRAEPIPDDVDWERKIRQTFFVGNRLARIPDDKRSRRVVLKVVASQFADGVRYPEAMFELLLKNIYPDTATLRRELLAAGFIRQDRAGYWRPADPTIKGTVGSESGYSA
jgi:DNA-binding transcriptional ArsR family regulator